MRCTTLRVELLVRTEKSRAPTFFFLRNTTIGRSSLSAFQRCVDHPQTPTQWRIAPTNVHPEKPPSEQSIHVAIRCQCHGDCYFAALQVTEFMPFNCIGMAHWQAAELPFRRAIVVRRAQIFTPIWLLLHGHRIRYTRCEMVGLCACVVWMHVELLM